MKSLHKHSYERADLVSMAVTEEELGMLLLSLLKYTEPCRHMEVKFYIKKNNNKKNKLDEQSSNYKFKQLKTDKRWEIKPWQHRER